MTPWLALCLTCDGFGFGSMHERNAHRILSTAALGCDVLSGRFARCTITAQHCHFHTIQYFSTSVQCRLACCMQYAAVSLTRIHVFPSTSISAQQAWAVIVEVPLGGVIVEVLQLQLCLTGMTVGMQHFAAHVDGLPSKP